MNKNLYLLPIITGIITNILLLPFMYVNSWQIIISLLLSLTTIILISANHKKIYANKKNIFMILSIILNSIPTVYFIILFLYVL